MSDRKNSSDLTDDELRQLMEHYLPEKSDKKNKSKQSSLSDTQLRELMDTIPVPKEEEKVSEPENKSNKIPTIDLHFKKVKHAQVELTNFLQKQIGNPAVKKVLIITGKGLGSENYKSKLKPMVIEQLKSTYSNSIKSFQQAPPNLGGSGAVLVYLK